MLDVLFLNSLTHCLHPPLVPSSFRPIAPHSCRGALIRFSCISPGCVPLPLGRNLHLIVQGNSTTIFPPNLPPLFFPGQVGDGLSLSPFLETCSQNLNWQVNLVFPPFFFSAQDGTSVFFFTPFLLSYPLTDLCFRVHPSFLLLLKIAGNLHRSETFCPFTCNSTLKAATTPLQVLIMAVSPCQIPAGASLRPGSFFPAFAFRFRC